MRGLRLTRAAPLDFAAVDRELASPTGDHAVVAVEAAWVDGVPSPQIAGAAGIGAVNTAGDDARHLVGLRVLIAGAVPCGECDVCRRGGVAACPAGGALGRERDGALAESVLARGRWLCPLEGGLASIGPVDGALIAGPLAIGYTMYARAGLSPGQPVAVVGRGPIARALARIAESRGARPVLAAPDEPVAEVAARSVTAAQGERRPRAVFDVGEPGGLALAAALCQPASILVARPALSAAPTIDLTALLARDVALLGVAGAHPDLLPELAALVVKGELSTADLAEPVSWRALDGAGERAASAGRALVALID